MLAETVIAVRGGFGVQLAVQTAKALDKPVLAIPNFGGTSQKTFDEFYAGYKTLPDRGGDLARLSDPWSDGHSYTVVELMKSLVKNNPFIQWKIQPSLVLFCSTTILIISWLLLMQLTIGHLINNMQGLMAISVVLGSILHHGLKQFTNPTLKIKVGELLMRVLVGIIIGFGLTLAFMLGGLGITGSTDFLQSSDQADLFRIGIVFSAIGLAAGFLLESSETRLRTWLQSLSKE